VLTRYWRENEYSETVHHIFIDFYRSYNSFRREVLCNILTEFCIPMKPVRLIKMYLNETYGKVPIGKHVSDTFLLLNGLKHGDVLSPLLFSLTLEYAIRNVRRERN
jgi:hypothetical protein